jgi:hypothetical protein
MVSVKEKIEAGRKLVSTDAGMWAFFFDDLSKRINKEVEHMLMVNPGLGTLDAVKEIVQKYVNVVLTEKDCAAINAFIGLPQVLSAYSDVAIMQSFKESVESGKMTGNPTVMQTFRYAANMRVALNIIEEASARVRNDKLSFEERVVALQEFGISEYDSKKMSASGGSVSIFQSAVPDDPFMGGRYIPFDPYLLAGMPQNVSV